MGIAFAVLILSYLQLFIVGVLFVVLIGLGYEMNQKLDHESLHTSGFSGADRQRGS